MMSRNVAPVTRKVKEIYLDEKLIVHGVPYKAIVPAGRWVADEFVVQHMRWFDASLESPENPAWLEMQIIKGVKDSVSILSLKLSGICWRFKSRFIFACCCCCDCCNCLKRRMLRRTVVFTD
jgi:hypothetical protein